MGRKKKQREPEEPTNFCPIPPLNPNAQKLFIEQAPVLNRSIGHLIRAYEGFKNSPPEYKPYWNEIYKAQIQGIARMHRRINATKS